MALSWQVDRGWQRAYSGSMLSVSGQYYLRDRPYASIAGAKRAAARAWHKFLRDAWLRVAGDA